MKKNYHVMTLRYALTIFFLAISFHLMAQTNVREGYIITLQGDTIHGEIDFRTSAMNSKRCVFKQNGESTFKTYLPEDISGYRFTNNGIYYISKLVDTKDEGKKMLFVEYILHGNMNLYQVGEDEMLLEDEDGNMAKFSSSKVTSSLNQKEIRDEMRETMAMLSKSEKATNILLKNVKNREYTKRAVMAYVDEVCTDGTCEPFEYKSRNIPSEDRITHPWIKIGMKSTQYKFWDDKTVTGLCPQISAGFDFHLNRLLKGIMVNVGFTYENGRANSTEDAYEILENCTGHVSDEYNDKIKFSQCDVMIGPGYQFKAGPVNLNVKAGFIFRLASHSIDFTHVTYYGRPNSYQRVEEEPTEYRFDAQYGYYGGIGLEYPLKKFALTCDLQYIHDYNKWTKYRLPERTLINQSALCLSLGLKY